MVTLGNREGSIFKRHHRPALAAETGAATAALKNKLKNCLQIEINYKSFTLK